MPKGFYIRTEKHKRKMSQIQKISHCRPEYIQKARELELQRLANGGKQGRKPIGSIKGGGSIIHYHNKAQKLFGKIYCEECRISIEEYQRRVRWYKRFQMHCISGDYTILEEWNWKCLCCRCHCKYRTM